MKIAVILGTRPEIIKMSPVIREIEDQGVEHFVLHTGQHYSYNMDKAFIEQFGIPEPKYNLEVGSGTHAEETGKMLIGIEKILERERPDVILGEGDTNTVLSGALAGCKLRMKIGHIEAGLRSYDRQMPEEINRVLTDHVSNYLFAPTERSRVNLLEEGIDDDNIFVTGNTIVDAVMQNIDLANNGIGSPDPMINNDYFLVTLHRQENVDQIERLKKILEGLKLVAHEFKVPIIYPIHPRTKNRAERFNIHFNNGVKLIEPVGYLRFLNLLSNAKLVLTDSGGVQEEACILRVPCITTRDNTERPETLEVGSNVLAGVDPETMLEKAKMMINIRKDWQNPFGDGRASERIVKIIMEAS